MRPLTIRPEARAAHNIFKVRCAANRRITISVILLKVFVGLLRVGESRSVAEHEVQTRLPKFVCVVSLLAPLEGSLAERNEEAEKEARASATCAPSDNEHIALHGRANQEAARFDRNSDLGHKTVETQAPSVDLRRSNQFYAATASAQPRVHVKLAGISRDPAAARVLVVAVRALAVALAVATLAIDLFAAVVLAVEVAVLGLAVALEALVLAVVVAAVAVLGICVHQLIRDIRAVLRAIAAQLHVHAVLRASLFAVRTHGLAGLAVERVVSDVVKLRKVRNRIADVAVRCYAAVQAIPHEVDAGILAQVRDALVSAAVDAGHVPRVRCDFLAAAACSRAARRRGRRHPRVAPDHRADHAAAFVQLPR
mmetsp:Transcript_75947/g.212935  ORF Transcript_75947/g.212935 Transcript_75947/m.212935 type:complete len:368 (-) Transcript_75947:127-1230(-)